MDGSKASKQEAIIQKATVNDAGLLKRASEASETSESDDEDVNCSGENPQPASPDSTAVGSGQQRRPHSAADEADGSMLMDGADNSDAESPGEEVMEEEGFVVKSISAVMECDNTLRNHSLSEEETSPAAGGSEVKTEEANIKNPTAESLPGQKKTTNSNTPGTLRRSSRMSKHPPTSPNPNDTPSSVSRTTRSQLNPDIIAKQKSFMHKYQIAVKSSMDSYVRNASLDEPEVKTDQPLKRKWEDSGGADSVVSPTAEKKLKKSTNSNTSPTATAVAIPSGHFMESDTKPKTVLQHDTFCWACHIDGPVVECKQCPRVFHQRCVTLQSPIPPKWVCTECISVQNAEKNPRISADQLPEMLTFAIDRVKSVADSQPFFKPVDTEQFPQYRNYVVCPIDIGMLEERIAQKVYSSTRAFLADFRWILHNCIVFNSFHSKLTSTARTMMKVCKHEMAEIDTCADCYMHAHTKRDTWFLEPCRRPHLLLWAKLKGFPHWPAKAMKANKEGNVDVRFFGAHDRAWVPAKDCYLYSREMPMQLKSQRKANLVASVEEVDQHIKKLVERYGAFAYPPVRTPYNPLKEDEQLQTLIPGFKAPANEEKVSFQSESECEESIDNGSEIGEHSAEADPEPEEVDRTEDNNFLAMLQLAPRNSIEPIPIHTTQPQVEAVNINSDTGAVDVKPLQGKSNKVLRPSFKVSNVESDRSSVAGGSGVANETPTVKPLKIYMVSPSRRSSATKESVPYKTEPNKEEEKEAAVEIESEVAPEAKGPSISLSINNVVGNYKPNTSSAQSKPKMGEATAATKAATPKATVKPNSKPSTTKLPAKPNIPKSSPKVNLNKPAPPPPPQKTTPVAAKSNATKSNQTSHHWRELEDEEDMLDPAMYLDPTITITLVNSEPESGKSSGKNNNDVSASSAMSSSDLQALNALGENVSITVVPKKKSNGTNGARSKENELVNTKPMVIEVDPASLQKIRSTPVQTPAKARKSFLPKSRPGAAGQQQSPHNKSGQKNTSNSAAAAAPPMVTIPSRHLGMEISRPSNTTQQQPSSSRIPSITVRPVSHVASSHSSILLQSGSADATPSITKLNGTSAANSSSDSTFNTGGSVLLGFSRLLSSSTYKLDSGSLTAHLTSRKNQIADMVSNTLESLLKEMSAAGNVESLAVQLQLDLERTRSAHQQEMAEMKRTLEEQRSAAEAEKERALTELSQQLQVEKQQAIEEIKKKQWCANCSEEAIFYCCWNTSYCDYPCQQMHWPKHMVNCANANQNTEPESSFSEDAINETAATATQKNIPVATVNGSQSHARKSKNAAHADVGYTVISSSDMSADTVSTVRGVATGAQ